MIKVFKDYNDIPPKLLSTSAQKKLEEILKTKKVILLSHIIDEYQEVKPKLLQIYHNKCAYCEQKIEHNKSIIERYRPRSLYYWLTFEWSNLLPTCFSCDQAKATHFGLQDESLRIRQPQLDRKEWLANSNSFLAEKPILLNPEIDEPSEHLEFLPDGRVIGITERGKYTIEILQLNREQLLNDRSKVISEYEEELNVQLHRVMSLFDEGAYRQLKGKGIDGILELAFESVFSELFENTNADKYFAGLNRAIFNNFDHFFDNNLLQKAFKNFKNKTAHNIDLDTQHAPLKTTSTPITISNIIISNIKCFYNVKIDFNNKDTILLGINGRGKTTVLQLLALALTRPNKINKPFGIEWKNVIREIGKEAFFAITLSIGNEEYTLKFNLNEDDEIIGENIPQKVVNKLNDTVILGYGVGRNSMFLPEQFEAQLNESFKDVATIFGVNSMVRNGQIEDYLKRGNGFIQIKKIITRIFNYAEKLENRVELTSYDEYKKTFMFNTPVSENLVPLEAMSSGFRTTFQWILDMVIRMWKKNYDLNYPENIHGIILIDEIDTHLHIKWQRTILNSLSNIFTNIQFIVTTHSPFVVQSISDKSIIALHISDPEDQEVIAETMDIENGSSYKTIIDKIFDTEDIFNIEIEDKFDQFYQKRDAILRGEANLDDAEFRNIINELSEQGEEVNNILRREQRQLEYLLNQ